jgi:hypothetical protein
VNYYTTMDPARFWVRHAYYRQDAEGREVLMGVAQETEMLPAAPAYVATVSALQQTGVRILAASLPRWRLLSDDGMDGA